MHPSPSGADPIPSHLGPWPSRAPCITPRSLSARDLQAIVHQVYGPKQTLEIPEGNAVFEPKIICVLSRMPFYRYKTYPPPSRSLSLSPLPS